ncbi:ubiquitin-conjugating enzyme E2 Z-like [Palaemon carinicauda]|uniref:ubiquitin-conjugating enzyme E2 Z-like n=1 Tax=Palaemon carinicauda TaxID=392227 RepID=UPI0035B5CD55
MELECSGADAETSPVVSPQHSNPNVTSAQSLVHSPPYMSSLALYTSTNSTPTMMSPTQSSASSSQSNSQSPTTDPFTQLLSTSVPASNSTAAVPPELSIYNPFDPLRSPDWDLAGPPGILCTHRVKKDLKSIFHDPLPGIFIVPDEENLYTVHCLIIGPFDTPYEGGFFHFVVRFGPQYPLHPPRVRLMTTGHGKVRFNPNLYKNGKVCLSILGTWSGPAWSPASNLSSVLLSVQSLMNEHPYHNEPGFDKERKPGASKTYNTIIEHETIRVSVLEQLNCSRPAAPEEMMKFMKASFLEYYDHYVDICKTNVHKDGAVMEDPISKEVRGKFQYGTMLEQLEKLKETITACGIPSIPNFPTTPKSGMSEAEDGDASSISSCDGNPGASDEEEEEEEVGAEEEEQPAIGEQEVVNVENENTTTGRGESAEE